MGQLTNIHRVPVEVQKGYRVVNGRNHGFQWEKRFQVVVEFDSEEMADNFEVLVNEWNEGKQRDSDFIAPF